jgi:hypothetical protein
VPRAHAPSVGSEKHLDRFIVGRRWIAVGGSACRSVLDERHNQFGGVLVLEGSPFMTAV